MLYLVCLQHRCTPLQDLNIHVPSSFLLRISACSRIICSIAFLTRLSSVYKENALSNINFNIQHLQPLANNITGYISLTSICCRKQKKRYSAYATLLQLQECSYEKTFCLQPLQKLNTSLTAVKSSSSSLSSSSSSSASPSSFFLSSAFCQGTQFYFRLKN